MKVKIIACVDPNGAIGEKGALPWKHIKEDMAYFREHTTAGRYPAVVMGRKTWDSLPGVHRPLPGRLNIIVSSSLREGGASGAGGGEFLTKGAYTVVRSLGDAYLVAAREGCDSFWIMGGGEIYRAALKDGFFVDEMHITHLVEAAGGNPDTTFPLEVLENEALFEVRVAVQHSKFKIKVYTFSWSSGV